MIHRVHPNESDAASFDAQVLITGTAIRLFAQQAEHPECYFFSHTMHTATFDEGLSQAFFHLPELALPYHTLRLSVDFGSTYVLVPDDFTQQGMDPTVWLMQETGAEKPYQIVEPISDLRCSIVSSLPEQVYEFCNRSFVVPEFHHPLRPLLEKSVRYSRRVGGTHLMSVLNSDEGYVDAILVSSGQVCLCNRYKIKNEIDVLYFLTSLWRQHEMNSSEDSMFIYGEESSPMLQALITHLESCIIRLHVNDYSNIVTLDPVLEEIRTAEPQLPESFVFALSL